VAPHGVDAGVSSDDDDTDDDDTDDGVDRDVGVASSAPAGVAPTRIAGRLRDHVAAWRSLGASAELLDVVTNGYEIPFDCDERSIPRRLDTHNGQGCRDYDRWLRRTVSEMVAAGAIRRSTSTPHIVSRVNVLEKSTPGKYRLIVDLRFLNGFVTKTVFKYETYATFRDVIEKDDYMFSLDLEQAYYHVDVLERHRKFLGFRLFGEYYEFCVLPFGLSDACRIFTELCKVPVRALRSQGLRVLPYLDDFLVMLSRYAPEVVKSVVKLLQSLGFVINFVKSKLDPTRQLDHLGFSIDTSAMTFALTVKRTAKFLAAAEDALADAESRRGVPARSVARVAGHASSASLVFGRYACLFTRYLHDAVRDKAAARSWSARVALGDPALAELRRWRRLLLGSSVAPIRRPQREAASVRLVVDASDFAFGGGVVSIDGAERDDFPVSRGVFEEDECLRSSTWRELRGASFVLESVKSLCQGRVVDLFTDSLSASFIHANGGSQNRGPSGELDLHAQILAIERTTSEVSCDLRVVWIPREINEWADGESKREDSGNYSVSGVVFAAIVRRFGRLDVDRFADERNHMLPLFNSRWWCPGSAGVDAFAVSWAGVRNWLHPHPSIIGRAIAKLRDDRARGVLLVPRWTSAQWWPVLFPSEGVQPVLGTLVVPRHGSSFVAGEEAAKLGHAPPAPWTMLALHDAIFSPEQRDALGAMALRFGRTLPEQRDALGSTALRFGRALPEQRDALGSRASRPRACVGLRSAPTPPYWFLGGRGESRGFEIASRRCSGASCD
jgi:hypothetical protein